MRRTSKAVIVGVAAAALGLGGLVMPGAQADVVVSPPTVGGTGSTPDAGAAANLVLGAIASAPERDPAISCGVSHHNEHGVVETVNVCLHTTGDHGYYGQYQYSNSDGSTTYIDLDLWIEQCPKNSYSCTRPTEVTLRTMKPDGDSTKSVQVGPVDARSPYRYRACAVWDNTWPAWPHEDWQAGNCSGFLDGSV